jgi:hypothetical protein
MSILLCDRWANEARFVTDLSGLGSRRVVAPGCRVCRVCRVCEKVSMLLGLSWEKPS